MGQDRLMILEDALARELADVLDEMMPLRFRIGEEKFYLDWAGEDLVDQDGNLYTPDIRVLLSKVVKLKGSNDA